MVYAAMYPEAYVLCLGDFNLLFDPVMDRLRFLRLGYRIWLERFMVSPTPAIGHTHGLFLAEAASQALIWPWAIIRFLPNYLLVLQKYVDLGGLQPSGYHWIP